MRLLVVGGGGREHALAWALARTATVFCAPGNPGTEAVATNLPLDISNHPALVDAVREHRIDLTVIGPEAPLAAGLADDLEAAGLPVFGPSAGAARIEASKAFAKELMLRAGIPTAASRTFTEEKEALAYVAAHEEPLVVKASGLAAGKGAVVCSDRSQAAAAVTEMFGGRFGEAGKTVVVEDFLEGEELSVFGITDGEHLVMLPPSQDHKRLQEKDLGPNTGGMGAYSPVSIGTEQLLGRVETEVMGPTLAALAESGAPYRGFLYAGLMIDAKGAPSVVEFNCRFGDPEAQVVLPILDGDLLEHLWAIGARETWRPADRTIPAAGAAVTTVLASPGYPDAPRKGSPIRLPDPIPEDTLLFHAGTARRDGELVTAGGRVLCATGLGPDVVSAGQASRTLAEAVEFEGKVFRRDIGWREMERAGARG